MGFTISFDISNQGLYAAAGCITCSFAVLLTIVVIMGTQALARSL